MDICFQFNEYLLENIYGIILVSIFGHNWLFRKRTFEKSYLSLGSEFHI